MQLNQGSIDWFLPIKHEERYWRQFTGGGRTFLDIGAHVGTWTLNLAPFFERVFAFEPDPRGWEVLSRNLEINGIKNVEIVPMAVSSKSGTVSLTRFLNPCTNTVMDQTDMGRNAEVPIDVFSVGSTSIDDFVASRGIADVDFMKVDTEGAEFMVVDGALSTLRSQAPDLFLEMHGLFYDRLRAKLPFMSLDVLDGGRAGMSLLRHRDSWPAFADPAEFRLYPDGTSPTAADMRALRLLHGIDWTAPADGFLSVGHP